jgi:predicted HTH domain antitoxin
LEGKIEESKRKKIIAIQLLKEGKIKKALKRFSNIVALYSSDKINQEAYD